MNFPSALMSTAETACGARKLPCAATSGRQLCAAAGSSSIFSTVSSARAAATENIAPRIAVLGAILAHLVIIRSPFTRFANISVNTQDFHVDLLIPGLGFRLYILAWTRFSHGWRG